MILTIGHSTRPLADFLALIREHEARLLVDVRRFPSSRRHPHFAGPALAGSLREAGIDYRHQPDLGGHRTPLADSPNGGWRDAFRGYADHMTSAAFRMALERVSAEAGPTVLMCAEADPLRCHRQLIADVLLARGVPVLHVLGPGRLEPHRLTCGARLEPDGGVVYPPPAGQARLFEEGG